jgi:hypothetical protein
MLAIVDNWGCVNTNHGSTGNYDTPPNKLRLSEGCKFLQSLTSCLEQSTDTLSAEVALVHYLHSLSGIGVNRAEAFFEHFSA